MRLAKTLLALSLLLFAAPAMSAPATWSFARASLGVHATGAITNDAGTQTSAFLPGAYLSYSLTSGVSLAGVVDEDFARHLTIGSAGIRFLVMKSERGQIGLGANLLGYGDARASGIKEPTSWSGSIHGSWAAARSSGRTLLWGIASASYDPENDRKEVRVGLRYQVVGGSPWREVVEP